jgi:hypothetical protein
MNEFWHGTGLRVYGITVTQRGTLDYRRPTCASRSASAWAAGHKVDRDERRS